jgi:zinc protease
MSLRIVLASVVFLAIGIAKLGGQSENPAIRTFALKNSMRATLIHTGTTRKAFVSLVLLTGEADEPAFGPGLASLTANMLLEGTVARSARQIQTEAATLGTTLAVRAGPITTSISGEVETAKIPRLLALIADLVRHPLLDTAGFGRVRRNAIRTLDSTLKNPADLAKQQWRAIVFPDGPFGHPYAFAATLGALQLGHVRNVYDDNYSASRAHLYLSGAFDDAATEIAVREVFSDWKAGAAAKPRAMKAITTHELVTVDQPGAARSVIWIGLPVIDPADREFAKLEVAGAMIAGSDLWQRRGAAYWVDTLNVTTENTGAALAALFRQLAALKRDAPAEADVARARANLVAAFNARNSSRDGLVSLMEFMDEHSLGDGWRTDYIKRVTAVTPEDVRAAVTAYLDPAHMAIAIVGDRALIEPQLAKLRPIVP